MQSGSRSLIGGLCWFIGISIARAGVADADAQRAEGLREYESGHYEAAAAHFRTAAESGDARSAEMLCLMGRFGATLYRGQVVASRRETARWAAVAAEKRLAAATTTDIAGP